MKKIVILLLLPLYLLSHAGLAYSLHFCGEALTSFSWLDQAEKPCACEKPHTQSDCCAEQHVDLDTDDGQASQLSYKLDAPKVLLSDVFPQLLVLLSAQFGEFFTSQADTSSPPYKVPLYLLAHVFRL